MSGLASTNDLADKTASFEELAPGLHGDTAEGDPNGGTVVGNGSVRVAGAQAAPLMAADVLAVVQRASADRWAGLRKRSDPANPNAGAPEHGR